MISNLIVFLKFTVDFFGAVWRDLVGVKKMLTIRDTLIKFEKEKTNTAERFSLLVKQHPSKPCIIFNDETWTFKQVNNLIIFFKKINLPNNFNCNLFI